MEREGGEAGGIDLYQRRRWLLVLGLQGRGDFDTVTNSARREDQCVLT